MNKVILIGNLTRDPQLRTVNTANGEVSVCSFGIAVNRRQGRNAQNGQEQTDFFNITAWRQLGELCSRYLQKGRKVCVTGQVSCRTYQAQDGTTRASLEVTADDIEFLSSRSDDQAAGAYTPAAPAAPAPTAQNNGFQAVETDELPF